MDSEKNILDIVQGLMDVVRTEQRLRERLQEQVDSLLCEVAELRTKLESK